MPRTFSGVTREEGNRKTRFFSRVSNMIFLLKSEPNSWGEGGEGSKTGNPRIFALQQRKVKEVPQKNPQLNIQESVKTQNSFVSKEERSDCSGKSRVCVLCRAGGDAPGSRCRDCRFPEHKGPKSLQYSNSLNETPIFRFLQLVSAMSSVSIPCVLRVRCRQDLRIVRKCLCLSATSPVSLW